MSYFACLQPAHFPSPAAAADEAGWCRDLTPSKLHDLRSCAVNNTRLACVAVTMQLHRLLLHASPSLGQDMAAFAAHLEALTADKAAEMSGCSPEVGTQLQPACPVLLCRGMAHDTHTCHST